MGKTNTTIAGIYFIQFLRVCAAENLNVEDGSVQLITVMTAVHWFDHPKFFAEGLRVLAPGGVMALFGYCKIIYEWDRNPVRNQALEETMEEVQLVFRV